MNKYEEGMKILENRFGHGKDNVIALATIDLESGHNGKPVPCVRDVDGLYADGVFYVTTYAQSRKVQQIKVNDAVALSVNMADFFANGTAKNLGWIKDPNNEALRQKLRTAFKEWYDFANDEEDPNCCIVAIYLEKGTLRINHGEKFYYFDFTNQTAK